MEHRTERVRRGRIATAVIAGLFLLVGGCLLGLARPGTRALAAPAAERGDTAGPHEADQAPDPRVVARFEGGEITLGEVVAELRSRPPGLKFESQYFRKELAEALAARRALANEARRRKLVPAALGPLPDRRAVRALLAAEGLQTPLSADEGRVHYEQFRALVNRVQGGPVTVERPLLEEIPVDAEEPILLRGSPGGLGQLFFIDDDAGLSCRGWVDPSGQRYSGTCTGALSLRDYLGPKAELYLESTYGPVEGFLHALVFDHRHAITLRRSWPSEQLKQVVPPPYPASYADRYSLEAGRPKVTGTVDGKHAQALLEQLMPAFSSCNAYYHWNNAYPEKTGRLEVRVIIENGRATTWKVEVVGFTPPGPAEGVSPLTGFNHADCLLMFGEYRWIGTGEVTFTAQVRVD